MKRKTQKWLICITKVVNCLKILAFIAKVIATACSCSNSVKLPPPLSLYYIVLYAEGCEFDSRPRHTNSVKIVVDASSLGVPQFRHMTMSISNDKGPVYRCVTAGTFLSKKGSVSRPG